MKSVSFIVGLVSVLCLSLTSCVTCKQSAVPLVPFSYIVQAETEVSYEFHLDGKFVSSGQTLPPGKGMQMCEMTSTPGDHVLMVTAPGYETWQRTVTMMSGTTRGSHFRIDLKNSEK
ncbi:MAG: hypothetical protein WC047_02605 [Kiritimatiellales bacterium]